MKTVYPFIQNTNTMQISDSGHSHLQEAGTHSEESLEVYDQEHWDIEHVAILSSN